MAGTSLSPAAVEMITLVATGIKGIIVQVYSGRHFTGTDFHLQLAYDDRIPGEYEEVLLHAKLHISLPKMRAVIDHNELTGNFVPSEPPPTEGYTELDDIMYSEDFITSNAGFISTTIWETFN